jgi:hypothetical protein
MKGVTHWLSSHGCFPALRKNLHGKWSFNYFYLQGWGAGWLIKSLFQGFPLFPAVCVASGIQIYTL